ncbi:hypothetical protein Gasu2_02080 [Galdieria sulphuraria]|uniref:Beta-Ig-H3/fasciclin n=1 Tax=Galdieria sulphuraria TaxID=130081 RepID=M2WAH4_GALSU|nr:beta-Ig-H3/fasciclin [Galdieria sulphuraria]EME32886.1 beta-Ig-H3/fasciclin [Galdieria sulphuraria]GJD05756.1 hypothetical protein Gasu2_02080 [Galdieria sulphuraria]|eukprot:XP_005709406.1 beta-Ig-H3/fasciclin [Galdieria sulphuraria]
MQSNKLVCFILLVVVAATVTYASPLSHTSRSSSNDTIAAELEKMKNFTTLLTLANIANLTSTLEDPSLAVTLFAPTNAGISSTLKAVNISESAVVKNSTLVKMILEYHIVPQPLKTSNFSALNSFKTLEGSNVTVTKNSTGVFVNGFEIIKKNIKADKSIIQVIDGLLIPPGIVV